MHAGEDIFNMGRLACPHYVLFHCTTIYGIKSKGTIVKSLVPTSGTIMRDPKQSHVTIYQQNHKENDADITRGEIFALVPTQ